MIEVKLFFSSLWKYLRPFVKQFFSRFGVIVLMTALDAARQVAEDSTIVEDDQKRHAAFKLIEADLKQKGIAVGLDVGTSMINSAIEAAVAWSKEE